MLYQSSAYADPKTMDGIIHSNDLATEADEISLGLIGKFRALSDTSPSYFRLFTWVHEQLNYCASVDMVRLRLIFDGEWLSAHAQTFDSDETIPHVSKIKPGGYLELWQFRFGDTSVALGIGWFEKSGKVNMHKGFIEFNPNKLAGDDRFWRLLEKIGSVTTKAELKRFDLAMDVPIHRYECRLSKDRRKYKSVISNGITEYLGRKDAPGYVKVYDKAAELKLADGVDLTRIELTCDGEWTTDKILKHWPIVHGWTSNEGTKDWVRVVGIMLAEKAERDEDIEELIAMLGRGSRPKVRKYLAAPLVELPEAVAAAVLEEARAWTSRL